MAGKGYSTNIQTKNLICNWLQTMVSGINGILIHNLLLTYKAMEKIKIEIGRICQLIPAGFLRAWETYLYMVSKHFTALLVNKTKFFNPCHALKNRGVK